MESLARYETTFTEICRIAKPPPNLTISEWADTYGVLTAGSSSEQGRWKSYSYQVAMMDAFCHPEVETVTVMKSARIGYTKIIGHVVGYYIHQDPCSILIVQPTIDDAEGYSKEEIQPTVDETDVLRRLVGDSKSRSSTNTISKKTYPGGILHIVGANSPRGFRRITVRLVLFDEVDGYPPTAGVEGDQIKLGVKRSETFWNRKVGIGSTPTAKGMSRVSDSWKKSDQGYFFLKCTSCQGEHIRLFREPEAPIKVRGEPIKISTLEWRENDTKTAAWVCPDCGVLLDYSHHHYMVDNGRWVADTWSWEKGSGFTFSEGFSGHIGFRLWAGYSYSPNSTPAKLAREFLDCKDDDLLLKTFVNTVLGEEWESKGERANEILLEERKEKEFLEIPESALVLTAGVDIQTDRIELEVVAWASTEESWSIDYIILPGDTSQTDVWGDLNDALRERYKGFGGRSMSISGIAIDSGYLSKTVYNFCAAFRANWIYPVKGMPGWGRPVVESMAARARRIARRKSKKVRPELIGVDDAKVIIMRRLKLNKVGPGFCHFPESRTKEYFKQLTAEKLEGKRKGGRITREWVQTRPRNEALDCRVYAYAALLLIAPDWDSLAAIPAAQKKRPDKQAHKPQRRRRTR